MRIFIMAGIIGWMGIMLGCTNSPSQHLPPGIRVMVTTDVAVDTFSFTARNDNGTQKILSVDVAGRDLVTDPLILLTTLDGLNGSEFLLRGIGTKNGQSVSEGSLVLMFPDQGTIEATLALSVAFRQQDTDHDGFLRCSLSGVSPCDCDNNNASINPFRSEDCDTTNVDDDCSGTPIQEMGCGTCTPGDAMPCSPIAISSLGTPGKGKCAQGLIACNDQGVWGTECVGGVLPVTEINNDLDDDCDGTADDGIACGNNAARDCIHGLVNQEARDYVNDVLFGATSTCKVGKQPCTGGVWAACGAGNSADEVLPVGDEENSCDGKDEDCDGSFDENFDPDQDGFTACGTECTMLKPNGTGSINNQYVDCSPSNSEVRPPLPDNRCFGHGSSSASVELCEFDELHRDNDCRFNNNTIASENDASNALADRVCTVSCSGYYRKKNDLECQQVNTPTSATVCKASPSRSACLTSAQACTDASVSTAEIVVEGRPKCGVIRTNTCTETTAVQWGPAPANSNPSINGIKDCPTSRSACLGDVTGDDACTKSNGNTCTDDSQCISGHCAKTNSNTQVCCDTACSGTCQDCATGTCSDVINGTDDSCRSGAYCCNKVCVSAGGTYGSSCSDADETNYCTGTWGCNSNHIAACSSVGNACRSCSQGCNTCGECVYEQNAGVLCSNNCDDAGQLCVSTDANSCSSSSTVTCVDYTSTYDIYVATTGNDSNNCRTSNNACATLGGAIGKLPNTCTTDATIIHVDSGSYSQTSTVQITRGMVIQGTGTVVITVTSPNAPASTPAALYINAPTQDVIIDTVQFIASSPASNADKDSYGAVIKQNAARVELTSVSITSGHASDGDDGANGHAGYASIGLLIFNPGSAVVLDGVSITVGNGGKGGAGDALSDVTGNGTHGQYSQSAGTINGTSGVWSAPSAANGHSSATSATGSQGGTGGFSGGLSLGIVTTSNADKLKILNRLNITRGTGGQGGAGGVGTHGCGGAGSGGLSLGWLCSTLACSEYPACSVSVTTDCVEVTGGTVGAKASVDNSCSGMGEPYAGAVDNP